MKWLKRLFRKTDPVTFSDDAVLRLRMTARTPSVVAPKQDYRQYESHPNTRRLVNLAQWRMERAKRQKTTRTRIGATL